MFDLEENISDHEKDVFEIDINIRQNESKNHENENEEMSNEHFQNTNSCKSTNNSDYEDVEPSTVASRLTARKKHNRLNVSKFGKQNKTLSTFGN